MSYSYKLDKTVAKFLSKRDCKFLRIFDKQMQKLCENPYRKDVDIQYYSEWWDNHFRLRIGKYRFLYYLINQDLVIYLYDADSRWWIYK